MSLAVVATPTSAAIRSSSSSSQSSSSMRERSKSPATRRNQVRRVRSRAAVVFSSSCGERPKCLNRCYLLGPGDALLDHSIDRGVDQAEVAIRVRNEGAS